MDDIQKRLKEKLSVAQRVVVLGVGSPLRSDDGAGMLVIENLLESLPSCPQLLLCGGETAPENFTGKIKAFQPDLLIVVDACDVGLAPGAVVEIPPEKVGGPSFCSHMLPVKVMISYLVEETGTSAILLGFQYKTLLFDGPMSPEMEGAVDSFCGMLQGLIRDKWNL